MKKFWLVLFFVAAAQAGAATYVGSVDSGIASGWPLQNRFFASGQPTQVFATLNRTLQNPYTGETRGTVEYNVGYGEGHSGTTFTGFAGGPTGDCISVSVIVVPGSKKMEKYWSICPIQAVFFDARPMVPISSFLPKV